MDRSKPTYCCVAITEKCFMRCLICHKWKDDPRKKDPCEPDPAQWKKFIDSLCGMVDDSFQLNFAGGEALTHDNTIPLVEYASKKGIRTLLASNGWLIDENMSKRLRDAGLSAVSLSLDGVKEKTHDYIRGTAGAYERVMKAVRFLHRNAPNTEIHLCSLVSGINMSELADLVVWADANEPIDGIFFQAVTQPFNTPIDDEWHKKEEYRFLWPENPEEIQDVIDSLIDLKNNGSRTLNNSVSQLKAFKAYFKNPRSFLKKDVTCHLDETAINVTPTGDIFFCFYMDPIGNIKKNDIAAVWNSDKNDEIRNKIKSCKRNCQAVVNCNYREDEINI